MDKSKFFAAAEKAVQKGQIDKAIEAFEQIVRYDPNDIKALTRLADIRLKEEHYEKAIDALGRIGELYSRDGFYSKAVAIYKRILKLDKLPTRSLLIETHERLATLYGQLGLVSDAMSHYAIVVDYYDQMNEKDLLLSALKKVADLDPHNVDNQLKLVDLMMAQNHMESALEKLGQMETEANERSSTVDRVRVLEKFVEYFPRDLEKLRELVQLLINANEPKKALAKLQLAFKVDPRNPEILEMLIAAFQSLKQNQKARAVEIELLKLYRELGHNEKAALLENQMKNPESSAVSVVTPFQSDLTKKAASPPTASDPVEALVKAMPLSPEEKKVLTECDVYLKYGLSEKVYEVLRSKLSLFPKSLVLRWKLKVSTQTLKRDEETKHLLSEIILLAREQKLEIWKTMAQSELKELDARHPALQDSSSEATVEKPEVKSSAPAQPATKIEPVRPESMELMPPLDLEEVDAADVSIVVDDDFQVEMSAVSEISFQEVADDLKKDEKPVEAPTQLDSGTAEDLILSESDFSEAELKSLDRSLDRKESGKAASPLVSETIEVVFDEGTAVHDEGSVIMIDEAPHQEAPLQEAPVEVSQGEEANGATLSPFEEAEFYESQGLFEEALTTLRAYQLKNPKAPGIAERIRAIAARTQVNRVEVNKRVHELEALGRKVKMQVQTNDQENAGDEDFFDLAGELQSELAEDKVNAPPEVKDVFSAFKAGVAATIEKDDWQTHLDLGIAYREMMLLDDAIEEFKLVSQVNEQRTSALYQMGLTQALKNDWVAAERDFTAALSEPSIHPDQVTSIQYELAEAYFKLDKKKEARDLFAKILKADPSYREVSERYKLCS